MSEKMALVVFEQTSHVLAAVTRRGDSDGELTAVDLAGEALVTRHFDNNGAEIRLDVPANFLNVEVVDLHEATLRDPRTHVVAKGFPVSPSNSITNFSVEATGSGTKLTVSLDTRTQTKVTAWLHVEDDSETVTCALEIDAFQNSAVKELEQVFLDSVQNRYLVLVPGFKAFAGPS